MKNAFSNNIFSGSLFSSDVISDWGGGLSGPGIGFGSPLWLPIFRFFVDSWLDAPTFDPPAGEID